MIPSQNRTDISFLPKTKTHAVRRRYWESELFWLLVVCLIGGAVTIFIYPTSLSDVAPPFWLFQSQTRAEPESMLFVGDVMLARNVERLMDTNGTSYPFKGVRDMFGEHEVVVGNFEASIPEQHVRTPDFGFRFSVPADVVTALPRVGFTDMTLANNHAYDHGEAGYAHTRAVLADAGIAVGGNPQTLSPEEVTYHTLDGITVAIIPINAVPVAPPLKESTAVLERTAKESDVQIVFIHWGTEYKLVSNDAQKTLAHILIDAGADAIVGHHPHVVQEIEEYRGSPIFYSLGNCIFDQYWNSDVQTGLAVALSFAQDEVHYTLIPLSSVDTRSAPRPMNRVERLRFLDELASRSEKSLSNAIKEGKIIELLPSAGDN